MIEKRVLPSGRTSYRVRYYGPHRRERSRSFGRRRDAEAYEAQMASEMRRGEWVDPRRGMVTLALVWEEFERVGMAHLRATTRANYRAAWRNVKPGLGDWPVSRIELADVAGWVQDLARTRGVETVRMAHRVLSLVLDYAMATRRLVVNPARGVALPRRAPSREVFLTARQVRALADRLEDDGDIVLAMAYLGLRWSEMAALRVSDVDPVRRRVRVVERATEVGGRMDVSAPKSRASARHVPVPDLLVDLLGRRTLSRRGDELIFPSPAGDYLRNGNWRRRTSWDKVTADLGLSGITPHDLRRTYGSLARAAGADLRFIQKAMGHESITTTARIYAHLYDDELDTVAAALDRMSREDR